MKIIENIKVPTGNILIVEGEHGKLECLSLADYGKAKNIKADFLGFTDEINGVPHGELLPLTEKWVITISTQYGCSMNCNYCDVPKVGPGKNATVGDLMSQVLWAQDLHEITDTKRLNIHFARMGEPTFNPNVISVACMFAEGKAWTNVHPVVSTMMPRKNKNLKEFIQAWMYIKNHIYNGNAGLQLSINTTSAPQREKAFGGNACTLSEISEIMRDIKPRGRKITLNFALADEYIIDPQELLKYFNPDHYLCKITPMHETNSCVDNNIHTSEGYNLYQAYKPIEEDLKAAGYDVIVFVPSLEEDLGRITCGNAILSGSRPEIHCG